MSDPEALSILRLQLQAVSGACQVRTDCAFVNGWGAVEQHLFDPDVVVEPFEMSKSNGTAGDVAMHAGSAMT